MKITQVTKKNGQTGYRASVYLGVDKITGQKRRTTVTARTKKEVKLKANQALHDFAKNGYTVKTKPTVTSYQELADLWWDSYKDTVKPNTIQAMKGLLKNHLLPVFGSYQLDKLTTPTIQRQVNHWANKANRQEKGAFADYPLLHNINSRILRYGVALQVLDSNPARDVIVPRKKQHDKEKIKHLDNQELKQFLSYLDTLDLSKFKNLYDVTLYKLLLATGCRIGEALALEWSDIDLDSGIISITKTTNLKRGINSPKSKSSYRDIDIDRKTALMLKQYKKRQQIESWQLGRSETVVFSNFIQNYPNPQSLRHRLTKHFKLAKVTNVSFHGFRHTHASLLLNAGTPYKELQHRLGHSKISMTMDIYSHLSKENAKKTVSFYETAISNL